ncbi:hypothetical protein NXZ75_19540 [Lysinibacillus sphaericus]|uniref:phage/plasmid replication domain-containing protein n=1 Tax=Lysinibacillus sphaericus TaxID=1421 RepID=UPI002163E260|nr:phage/plasmid replication protein [Lysinibacillus sphaericus]MCS1384393.1 hypothetical protein [Lysinibacillus sphaericus]
MFDTVKFGIPIILTQQEIENVQWTDSDSKDKTNNNPSKTTFKVINKNRVSGSPFIRYTYKRDDISKAWLKVEVSIPKFLYGTNVIEIRESDLPRFYKKIRRYLAKELGMLESKIPHVNLWTAEKVHICKNFNVGDLKQSYLKAISNCTIAKYKRKLYFTVGDSNIETVEWKASNRKEKIYDKEAEIRQQKNYPEKNQQLKLAKGLLRFEVELSDNELRSINRDRLATKILTFGNARNVLQKSLERNGLSKGVKYTSHQQIIDEINSLPNLGIRSKSSLIAFVTEWLVSGKKGCRQKYAESSYWKNVKKLRELLGIDEILIGDVILPPLNVIKKQKMTAPVFAEQKTASVK